MTTDTDVSFPSITFPATFEGAGSIGPDFSTFVKLKPEDSLQTLADLRALPRGKYDVTIVSRQSTLEGDSVDREWANMDLQAGDERDVEYQPTCIGGDCPHFCVPAEGDLAGSFVCYHDPDVLMEVEHEVTRCPLYPEAAPEAEEAGGAEMAARGAGVVIALYPGDDEPHVTQVGEHTRYSELVADYLTAAGIAEEADAERLVVYGEEDRLVRNGSVVISADDYGKRLIVCRSEDAA
jgi:hypothetical protein